MEFFDTITEIETDKYLLKPMKRIQTLTLILQISLAFIIYFNVSKPLSLIFCVIVLILLPATYKFTEFTTFATIWDNMDYTGIVKRDLIFTTSDQKRIRGYVYYKEGIQLNIQNQQDQADKMKYPTIIGVHGYGSHHKVMDRYCLPSLLKLGYVYFTYDACGHGINKHVSVPYDPGAYQELADFISEVKRLNFVDTSRIGIIAMSYGASKASVVAYPDPDIKLIIFLSGIFDVLLNKEKAKIVEHIKLYLTGFRWTQDLAYYKSLSGIYLFKKEGIILRGQSEPTPNYKRIFIFSNKDDRQAHIQNTYDAIEKLDLPQTNYRIFPSGGHHFKGNEYYLSVEIFNVLSSFL